MFWYLWCFCAGSLLTLWVRRLPSEREYERFLIFLGTKGALLNTRCDNYRDVRLGIANWRRRRYWRQQIARHGRPVRVRSVVFALALCSLWPVLTASAPVIKPAISLREKVWMFMRVCSVCLRPCTQNNVGPSAPSG